MIAMAQRGLGVAVAASAAIAAYLVLRRRQRPWPGEKLADCWTEERASKRLEVSAGICLVRCRPTAATPTQEAVLLRMRDRPVFEVPKGHVEVGETVVEAAKRELLEETGLVSEVDVDSYISTDEYIVPPGVAKKVHRTPAWQYSSSVWGTRAKSH